MTATCDHNGCDRELEPLTPYRELPSGSHCKRNYRVCLDCMEVLRA